MGAKLSCAITAIVVPLVSLFPGTIYGAQRFMPFLCRDAVVKESEGAAVLVGRDRRPVIVAGKAAAGPREKFDRRQIAKAARTLQTHIRKITGVELPIVASSVAGPGPRIFVHSEGSPVAAFPELADADAHGFLIATRDRNLHIVGGSPVGTLYGVWLFLQNYCGLRIVMPGELGEVFERRDCLETPQELYVLNPGPDFLLRIHSLNNRFDGSAWLADFGGSQRFGYHHNTPSIYDPAKFGKTHPEYYPILRGTRYIPSMRVSGWQPTFSEPSVIQRAVEYADEQFAANPGLKSISLTPNDGQGFSELDEAKATDGGRTMADIYFAYVDAVAKEVKKRWPGRYVAFLAGYHFKEPPSFSLEDNCMPFAIERAGNPHEVLERWQGKVEHFGIYQWIYGNSFVVPNHWPHAMQDYLKLSQRYGTKALKTEFYDAYAHGGARLWVLSNLLWNTDADVDALLKDYFEHMYGKEATPAMTRYWAQWEQVYERRRTPTKFNLCLFPGKDRQFEDIRDQDLVLMQQALGEAAERAVGEAYQQRVDMTARLFENSRRYYVMWKHLRVLREYPSTCSGLAEAEKRLRAATSFLEAENAVYDWRYRKIEPAAMYCAIVRKATPNQPWPPNYLQMDPRLLYVYGDGKWVQLDQAIDRIVRYISDQIGGSRDPERAAAYWRQRAVQKPVLRAYAESEQLRLLDPNAALANLLPNGSFENAGDPDSPEAHTFRDDLKALKHNWVDADHCTILDPVCEGWNGLANRPYQKTEVTLDLSVKRHGAASLRIKAGGQFGGVITHIVLPEPHARYRLSFWYRGTGAGYGLMFERIRHLPYLDLKLPAAEDWTRHEVDIPFNWALMPDETGDLTLWLGIKFAKSKVWFDDIRIEMLSPAGVERK